MSKLWVLIAAWWCTASFTGAMWYFYSRAIWRLASLGQGLFPVEEILWKTLFIWDNVMFLGLFLLLVLSPKGLLNKIKVNLIQGRD